MIALIPQLDSSLAYLRPEAQSSSESFAEVLQAASSQTPPQSASPPQYVVQRGDTLNVIAKKLGYSNSTELVKANDIKNPDLIQVGQVLKLSPGDGGNQGSAPTALAAKSTQKATQTALAAKSTQGEKSSPASALEKNVSARGGTMVVASWYGANHQGKTMANGQPYNMYANTAAHRSLPMGTKLNLTNPANGRTATAEITDRGPFIRGRNLDVSYSVAKKLGMVEQGVAKLQMNKAQAQTPQQLSAETPIKPKLYL
ncbi:MAG: septal ring lytic transglycosylase RlpA family protein [Desulfobaccales bacterium]